MARSLGLSLALALAAFSVGACGGSSSVDGTADLTDDALVTGGVGKGLYFLTPDAPNVKGDYLTGMEVLASGRAHILYSYPGSPTRVDGSCLATAAVQGSGANKILALRCPASPFDFKITKNDAHVLELENDKQERFVLDKRDPEARADVRLTCDSDRIKVRLDVSELAGGSRRVLLHIDPKSSNQPDYGTPPKGIFVVDGKRKLKGQDFTANEYDLTLPDSLDGQVKGTLGFVNVMTPFQQVRMTHALSCVVEP